MATLFSAITEKIDEYKTIDETIPIRDVADVMQRATEAVVAHHKNCRIGSIHRNTLDYAREMKAFRKEDMPEKSLRAA